MIEPINLVNTTKNTLIDQTLADIINIYEQALPGRISAYYLAGSLSDGSAIHASDIDLYLVFKQNFRNEKERGLAAEIFKYCANMCSVEVSITLCTEETLFRQHMHIHQAVILKQASMPIYGSDIRDQILLPPADLYKWAFMHTPFMHIVQFPELSRVHPQRGIVEYPLVYPDPTGEFYGYDQLQLDSADPSVKLRAMLSNITSIVMALVALKTDRYVGRKSDAVAAYGELINDEWSSFIKEIYEVCRTRWGYRIPSQSSERQRLRGLCARVLDFENHFLDLYRDYLVAAMGSAATHQRIIAIRRLGELIYRSDDVSDYLRDLAQHDAGEAGVVARRTLLRIARTVATAGPAIHAGEPVGVDELRSYCGMYAGDNEIGRVVVVLRDDRLTLCSDRLGREASCLPLAPPIFECRYGLVEFHLPTSGLTIDIIGWRAVTLSRIETAQE